MFEKVRIINGIRKQRLGCLESQGEVQPMLNFNRFTPLHPLLATALTAFAATLTAWTPATHATIGVWPDTFRARQMTVSGGTQYVRVGGQGPAVLLLHGFGDTGDIWVPLAKALVKDHTVIVPDLRGMGLSSHPERGYEKTAQARDMAAILGELGIQEIVLITHDIGNMVGYAFAALYPLQVTKWVVMDASLPGIGHWDDQLKNAKVWHFNFRGPDVERLMAGRERILLDRFYNKLSANPACIDEQTRDHYAALYARPGAITTHSADSSPHSARMRSTTKNYLPRASCQCRSWSLAVIIPMAPALRQKLPLRQPMCAAP
jgi:pimeloyl-ACP methyl ester carboxylesterase